MQYETEFCHNLPKREFFVCQREKLKLTIQLNPQFNRDYPYLIDCD